MKNKIKIRTSIKIPPICIYYVPLLFLFLAPDCVLRINTLYKVLLVLLSIVSVCYIIMYILKPKYCGAVFLISVAYASICLSTILNHGNVTRFLFTFIDSVGFLVFFICEMSKPGRKTVLLDSLIFVFEFYVLINLLTIILLPNGLYRIESYDGAYFNPAYVLGHRNNAIEYFLPLCGLVASKNKLEGKKMTGNLLFVLIISSVTALLTWSVNEMLCMAFMIFSLFFFNKKMLKAYSVKVFFLISGAASAMLIMLGISPFIQNIVVNVFNKSPTMSGRTRIWAGALRSMEERPFFGHGIQDSLYNFRRLTTLSSCHNYFLDFWYLGGVITLVAVILLIVYLDRRLEQKGHTLNSFFSIFFFSYFILWLATPIHREKLFIMLTFFVITLLLSENMKKTFLLGGLRQ